jgi:quinol monooxygenase YgiN
MAKRDAEGYAITVAFELVPGAAEAFLAAIRENAERSVAVEPRCRRFDVLTPIGEGPAIFLYEIYADRAAFEDHLASAHFRRFDEATRHMVAKKTVHAYAVFENAKTVDAAVPARR